ncbi:MAG: hypothetical protein IJ395_02225 [Clostridia bacterium]|nr:hypothetical protein [Clostridia bacterium]
MKKFCLILLAIILGICLLVSMMFFGFLYSHQKSVISSLPDYESREFYTSGGFQDYTDYAKYFYDSITAQDLESSEHFTVTTDEDVEEILLHIDDFERAVAVTAEELKENYDFDRSIVTEGDYFCIETKFGEPIGQGFYEKFHNYSVYYFDIDAQIMYYFHHNI